MPRDYLADRADQILAVAVAALAEPVTGVPAPGKVFVSFADPVADLGGCCDDDFGGGQLTVHLGGPAAGDPLLFPQATKAPPCMTQTNARYTVSLMRCYPAVDEDQADWAPTAAALTARTRQFLVDLWCLVCGLRDAIRDEEFGACGEIRIVQSRQLSPLGGCAGWQVVLELKANDGGPGVGS